MNLNFGDIENDGAEFAYYSRRKRKVHKVVMLLMLLGLPVILKIIGGNAEERAAAKKQEVSQAESVSVQAEEPAPPPEQAYDFWNLVLVNRDNALPPDFTVELADIGGGEQVDARIEPMLKQMMQDAAGAGANLTVCSGYRSRDLQDTLFAREKDSYQNQGYSEEESYTLAGKYVQPPGSSEHETGLAVDFLTDEWKILDEGFADTTAYRWLQAHAAEYGFIERYPAHKEDITGVSWEPWHYRYVGPETAQIIIKDGVTLEEYVSSFRQK